jgi:RNA polymerase primary sigma factor
MSDSLGSYLQSIGTTALLTAAEERELSRLIEIGRDAARRLASGEAAGAERAALRDAVRVGAEAKERFIHANLRLVVHVARKYPRPDGMDLSDLVQEGNLGLEHAVDKFDGRRGFKFSTYATFWIRQHIGRALDNSSRMIRLPADRSAQLRAALRRVHGDPDTLDAVDAELYALTAVSSLDRSMNGDNDTTLGEMVASEAPLPDDVFVVRERAAEVHELLDLLDHRARRAVEARFGFSGGEQMSYRRVGELLGVTGEAARRLVQQSLERLREDMPADRSTASPGTGGGGR